MTFEILNNTVWAGEMAQWVDMLAAKPGKPKFNAQNPHGGRRELTKASSPMTSTHVNTSDMASLSLDKQMQFLN